MNRLSTFTLIILSLFCLSFTTDSSAQFHEIETKDLRLVYAPGLHSFLTPHVVRCFENAMQYHKRFWGFEPSEKVTVALFDICDYSNAGAAAVPEDKIMVFIAPSDYALETTPANERINTMMNHELVHIVAMDKACGRDKVFRSLFFGKVKETAENPLSILYGYLTAPRVSSSRWYHEGIAVFLETFMAGGLGRALGAYDEMFFRTMVRDSAHFYDPIGIEAEGTQTDFQVGVNAYLYGTRFMSYLSLVYGPDKIVAWVRRDSGSKAHYTAQFKHVFGKSLSDGWADWVAWENEFQEENLRRIREYPTTDFRPVSSRALGSVSKAVYDKERDKIYFAVNFPGQMAHIAEMDPATGEMKKLTDIKGASLYTVTSLAWDQSTGTLFYTTDNNNWRDICALDVKSGKCRMLMKDGRVGDLTVNKADNSLWGIRHYNGISTIVRVAEPYDQWDQVYSFPYGRDMYDIDVSPDGKWLTGALAKVSGHQSLVMFNIEALRNGDSTYTTLYDFGHSNPANFVFSDDGRYLYGSSYYTGVSNIFRYDREADSMEALSNCETGFFRPLPLGNDSLLVFRYTGDGFLPSMIAEDVLEDINPIIFLGQQVVEKHDEVVDWIASSPAHINYDSVVVDSGSYRALGNLRLSSIYPIVEGYKDYAAFGMRANFDEPIGLYQSRLYVGYTPNMTLPSDERWHAQWNFSHYDWDAHFSYNGTDFYDLFGPTKTSRKGIALGVGYTKNLVYDLPKKVDYRLSLTGYTDLERLPDYQNVNTTYNKFLVGSAMLSMSNQTASLGAVDYETGYKWGMATKGTLVNRVFFPKFVNTFDVGVPLPINHSSVWLRTSAGVSHGDRANPFANFYFGGFGNNWVDYRTEKRYRVYYSFPGVELNEIGGTNFGKAMLEWNMPPLRFRRLGFSWLFAMWARPALFATGLVTNVDDDPAAPRSSIGNVGGQIDVRMMLLARLRLTFSVGYAAAFERGYGPSDEFMISLKIL